MTRYLRQAILVAATIAALGTSGTGCSSNGSPAGTGAGGASSGGATGPAARRAAAARLAAGAVRADGELAARARAARPAAEVWGAAASQPVVARPAGVRARRAERDEAPAGWRAERDEAGGRNAGGAGGGCPAPSATGEMVTSLAGTWTFTPSGAAATTITVPGGGWVAQGFRSTNEANYQRMATVPDLGRAQATYLEFGAVNHQATLTVDSTMVGTQTTSFTPSVFDVTSVVKPGMSHSFTVDVKGRNALKGSSGKKLVPDAAGWSGNVPQGIFRSAVLHVVPALHVFETLVRTDVAADQFSIDVSVKNDGASTATGTVDVGLVELDLRRYDLSDGSLEAGLRRRGTDGQGDAGPDDVGAGRNLVLVAERPLRAGIPGQAARRTRDGDSGRGRRRRGCRALDPGSLRVPPDPSGHRALRAERRADQVPRRQRPGRGLRQHQDRRRQGQLGRVRPVSGLLAAVGQQPGVAAGRG